MAAYGKTQYWDERYTKDPEPFDWYQRYSGLQELLNKSIKKDDNILMVGSGNSRLSEDMYEDGYVRCRARCPQPPPPPRSCVDDAVADAVAAAADDATRGWPRCLLSPQPPRFIAHCATPHRPRPQVPVHRQHRREPGGD